MNIIPVPRRRHITGSIPLTDCPADLGSGLWRGGPETAAVLAALLAGGDPTPVELAAAGVARVLQVHSHAPAPRCCRWHDREPDLYPVCGPDDVGGYCCDNCPTLAADEAVRHGC